MGTKRLKAETKFVSLEADAAELVEINKDYARIIKELDQVNARLDSIVMSVYREGKYEHGGLFPRDYALLFAAHQFGAFAAIELGNADIYTRYSETVKAAESAAQKVAS